MLTKAKLSILSRIYLFGWTFLLLWPESFFPACGYQMSSRCWPRSHWPVKPKDTEPSAQLVHTGDHSCCQTPDSPCIVFSIPIKSPGAVWEQEEMIWHEIIGNCNASVGDSFSQPLFTISQAQMEGEKLLPWYSWSFLGWNLWSPHCSSQCGWQGEEWLGGKREKTC